MVRMIAALFLFFAASVLADNIWIVTNDFTDPIHASLSGTSGESGVIAIHATDISGAAINLSSASTNLLSIANRVSGYYFQTDSVGEIFSATGGIVRWTVNGLAPGAYLLTARSYPNSYPSAHYQIGYHFLTITATTAAAACPDMTVEIAEAVIQTGITSTGETISVTSDGGTNYNLELPPGSYATGTPVYVEADPVWESEKASYATGTPLYAFTESDLIALADTSNRFAAGYTAPAWDGSAITGLVAGSGDTFATNPIANLADVDSVAAPAANDVLIWNGAAWTNAPAPGGTDTGAVQKVGDTMTGPLFINSDSETNGLWISSTNQNIRIGRNTSVIETSANAIGDGAKAGLNSVALGTTADSSLGSKRGVAVGSGAKGYNYGVGVGLSANGTYNSVAIGNAANGYLSGVAVGDTANGSFYGISLGRGSKGFNTNIAIGVEAISAYGSERIAIGHSVSNPVDDSIVVRGTLYLDGGTGVAMRATFGTGAYSWFQTDGVNLFFVNSTGGTVQVTEL